MEIKALSICKTLPTFRRTVVPSSPESSSPRKVFFDRLTLIKFALRQHCCENLKPSTNHNSWHVQPQAYILQSYYKS